MTVEGHHDVILLAFDFMGDELVVQSADPFGVFYGGLEVVFGQVLGGIVQCE